MGHKADSVYMLHWQMMCEYVEMSVPLRVIGNYAQFQYFVLK